MKKGNTQPTPLSGKEMTERVIGGIRIDSGAKRMRHPTGQQIPDCSNISGKSLY